MQVHLEETVGLIFFRLGEIKEVCPCVVQGEACIKELGGVTKRCKSPQLWFSYFVTVPNAP